MLRKIFVGAHACKIGVYAFLCKIIIKSLVNLKLNFSSATYRPLVKFAKRLLKNSVFFSAKTARNYVQILIMKYNSFMFVIIRFKRIEKKDFAKFITSSFNVMAGAELLKNIFTLTDSKNNY